jgi:hypothetical protein
LISLNMKRLIILTTLLLVAIAVITVAYFKKLNPPGTRTSQVIGTIPTTAALIFEFNNDDSFYEIYDSSTLFTAVVGQPQLQDLHQLQESVLRNPTISRTFAEQNIYVSVHPQTNGLELLYTLPASQPIAEQTLTALHDTSFTIGSFTLAGKPGFTIHLTRTGREFYLLNKGHNIYEGSFSKTLLAQAAAYAPTQNAVPFKLLSDQQSANSLANLYVNNTQLKPLLSQLFRDEKPDFLKVLSMMPATAALSLNYKSDALMFSGYTSLNANGVISYLSLFRNFHPVNNNLKNIFPLTTAYSNCFGVDSTAKFIKKLDDWEQKAGLQSDKAALFRKVKQETGVQFNQEFNKQLGHEFAVLTTRFDEKIAIIELKNGTALRPFLSNISTMTDAETGQLNYSRIPYFLLGDAFSLFRRPYFIILDNYLILTNTPREISNYKDNYLNARFLSHSNDFNDFNNLLSRQSNVAFYINFKNAGYVFKHHLTPQAYQLYQQHPGLSSFYGTSYQLSASENEFYTNFCMKIDKRDTNGIK